MYRLKNSLYWIMCLLCVFACQKKAPKLPFYNTPNFEPVFVGNADDIPKKISHTIDTFSLINQDNQRFTNQNIEGKIHVAAFVFTTCGSICPTITRNMLALGDTFLNDSNLLILSFSVMPWVDSAQKLKEYRQNYGISNPRWHFLTGSKAQIYRLARTSYFAEENIGFSKDSSQFLHTEHLLLVDKTGRIRGIYNGTLPLEIVQLIGDIRALECE